MKNLKNVLIEAGDKILAEASPYDKIWGIEMDVKDLDIKIPYKWKRQYLSGFSVMNLRYIIIYFIYLNILFIF